MSCFELVQLTEGQIKSMIFLQILLPELHIFETHDLLIMRINVGFVLFVGDFENFIIKKIIMFLKYLTQRKSLSNFKYFIGQLLLIVGRDSLLTLSDLLGNINIIEIELVPHTRLFV